MIRVVSSTSAAARLDAARRFLSQHPSASERIVVGASRGAADDLARAVAREAGATFGLMRFSLAELAARSAAMLVDGPPRLRGTQAGEEAIAARAVFDAAQADELAYFAPVAGMPGFPRALARTLYELRLAGAHPDGRDGVGDIGRLLERFDVLLDAAAVDDRAAVLRAAATACASGRTRWTTLPIVFLDVPLDSRAEQDFVWALASRAPDVLITIPDGDAFALTAMRDHALTIDVLPDEADATGDLIHLRRHVFEQDPPPERERAGDVTLFSAPGEGREAIEIVRRVLDEAARGVPFDDLAVFLRTPLPYLGLLEHACARAGVPVYFDRGTRRPDPAGRAFVALLSCAVEGLSAKRFDEYLSLGQVPVVTGQVGQVGPAEIGQAGQAGEETEDPEGNRGAIDSDEEAIVAGTLRAPWKWEELIVESSVVGGGKARWRRRLDGLAQDFGFRLAELRREEPESPRIARLERDLRNLAHLRGFALPIVDTLDAWPERSTWGDWLDRFAALAATSLRRPARVRQLLADLRPMAAIGPVTLEEARDVLHDRLVSLDWDPPDRRYGRLFVGTPHQARGRAFRVVFVPGLAERVVPQRPREDPLLLDDDRRQIDAALVVQEARGTAERLLLKIAIGAATERLYLSYPRLDVAETRARVPSFYALDVMRAITGRVPDHRALARDAADESGASLAWPAPKQPERAIDDLEHDLATLRLLLDATDRQSVKGHAHYMLGLNAALRRSVISRWARDKPAWSPSDGLIRVTPPTQPAIDANRLHRAKGYSLTALQRFSACPYQFLLASIHRLQPWDEPEPLMRMDPLTRGSLFHQIQADFLREMDADGRLPVAPAHIPNAVTTLDRVIDRVAAQYAERLAPAIDRVWRDEVGEIRRDLGIWLQKLADGAAWRPEYFEYSFGLNDAGRDPRSLADPVTVGDRFVLRGSVDVIEHDDARDVMRVTDHKTGKNRSKPDLIVDGGKVLQPVLYSMAVERALGKPVESARLYFATTTGGFAECVVPLNDYTRAQGLQVLTIVDRSIEHGFLAAAPDDGVCRWCDFRPVCGPREEERVARKHPDALADLRALRSMR